MNENLEPVQSYDQIVTILDQCLAISDFKDGVIIQPESHIETDLGAESIDNLDIIFRLQKSFNISIKQDDYFTNVFDRDDFTFSTDPEEHERLVQSLAASNEKMFPGTAAGSVERLHAFVDRLLDQQAGES